MNREERFAELRATFPWASDNQLWQRIDDEEAMEYRRNMIEGEVPQ
jgi:hypothetical protein